MSQTRLRLALCAAVLCAATVIGAVSGSRAVADDAPTGTISVARACYVNTASAAAKITITGSGWQPGEAIELTDKLGRISSTATAAANGTFTASVLAPVVDPYKALQISDTIEAYEEGTPDVTATADSATASSNAFLTTNFAVLQTGNKQDPEKKTIFELSGFTPNATVYAHYLSQRGALLDTVTFGRSTGPCGLRRVVTYEYPGGHPKPGAYTIQFDDTKGFSKLTTPQYRFSFKVFTSTGHAEPLRATPEPDGVA